MRRSTCKRQHSACHTVVTTASISREVWLVKVNRFRASQGCLMMRGFFCVFCSFFRTAAHVRGRIRHSDRFILRASPRTQKRAEKPLYLEVTEVKNRIPSTDFRLYAYPS